MKYMFLAAVGLGLVGLGALLPYGVETSSQEKPFVVRVPEEYATIQAAVDAVAEGGTVLIGPGTYQESIKITKSLRLIGTSPGFVTIGAPYSIIIDIQTERPSQIYLADFNVKPPYGISEGISVRGPVQLIAHQVKVSKTQVGFSLGNDATLLSRVGLEENLRGVWHLSGLLEVENSFIEGNGAGISVLFGGSLKVTRSALARNFVAIEIGGGRMGGEVAELVENAIIGNEGGLYMALGPIPEDQEKLRAANQPELGPAVVIMKSNEIVGNNRYGIALLECLREEPHPLLLSIYIASLGMEKSNIAFIEESNRIEGNGKADLCPADYPWPPGFRKP